MIEKFYPFLAIMAFIMLALVDMRGKLVTFNSFCASITCNLLHSRQHLMPRSQMANDASATPLPRIFPQFLAMIVQFYRAGKAAAAIVAAPAATADSLARS